MEKDLTRLVHSIAHKHYYKQGELSKDYKQGNTCFNIILDITETMGKRENLLHILYVGFKIQAQSLG